MMDFTGGLPGKRAPKETTEGNGRARRFSGWFIAFLVAASLAIIASTTAVVFFVKYNDLKKDPVASAQRTKADIVAKVAALYDVPNEEPTMARVSNQEKLRKEQEFFANANNGDYVLVYPEAKLGILYRESTNKIINIGPVETQSDSSGQSADETQDQ